MGNHYFVGVDIGGTNVDAILVDSDLQEQAFETAPIRSTKGLGSTAVIIQVIEKLLSNNVADWSQIVAIGVGVPGLVEASTGQVDLAVNLDEQSIALGPILQNHFGRPVFVENDANAVALGASKFLVDPSIKNLAFITIGTGVGAGLVLGGNIFHGSRNMAGEIGHMFVRESEVRCQCGNYGCLETFIAGPAIARLAKTSLESNSIKTSLRECEQLDAAVVFNHAEKGDKLAIDLVDEVGTILARAMQGMMMSFDLEKIIIGGGISRAGDTLLRPILKEWEKMRGNSVMAAEMLQADKVVFCPADYRAGSWGAVAVGLVNSSSLEEQSNLFMLKEPMVLIS